MRTPTLYKRKLMQLSIAGLVSNLFSVLLAVFYFANIGPRSVTSPGSNPAQVGVAGGMILLLLVSAILLGRRMNAPLWDWYRSPVMGGVTGNPPSTVVQQKALNLPYQSARVTWLLWALAGVILAFIGLFDPATVGFDYLIALQVLFGALCIIGPTAAVLQYISVERVWRTELPRFFNGTDMTQVSAFRLRIRNRMLILFVAGALPLILLVLLSYNLVANSADLAEDASRLLLLEAFLGGSGVVLAVLLARTLGKSLVEPIEQLAPHLEAVQRGVLDVRLPVTSNDELGVLAKNFNGMLDSIQRRDVELRTIYEISREITHSLELDHTLQAILEQVREIIPYDGGEICLYDKVERVLRVRAWTSSAQVITDTRGRSYNLGEGYTGWVGAERQSLLIPDVDRHTGQKPTVRQIADGVFLNGYLGVPLLAGQQMVGTLEIVSAKKDAFNDHTRQILEIIAPQAAIAIANAEQVIERERTLRAQIEQLKIEIDQVKRSRQVSEITETGFFQKLKEDARRMRRESRGDGDQE
ncbi:MAG: HAMP domain-containing protein [Chloroflexi bacterium]|nr:HAMP domain-containing protein [Chloroflexota bacterium]